MTTILNFIINMLIMGLIISFFALIGQIANRKFFNQRFKYHVPLGFAWFMITFQFLSFPFILLQTTFSAFLIAFVGFAIAWAIYIILNRKYIKFEFSLKPTLIVSAIIAFVFFIIASKSYVYSDSWLYSAMITSTIQNNLIYSHNGTLANVQLSIMHHRFESYYLWQAVISMIYSGKYLFALVTEYKLFDACLIVFTYLELAHQFKIGKYKSYFFAFLTFCMIIAAGMFLDLSPFQTSEPPVQFFQISTGTALFHYYMIPLAIIYMRIENSLSNSQKYIYLIGMLLVFSSLSTTFYYTLPLFYITLLAIKHLIQKEKDNPVLIAFMSCWYIIITCYIGVMTTNLLYIALFTVGYIGLTALTYLIYQKLSIKVINVVTYVLGTIYVILAIVLFNPIVYMGRDFTTDKQALRIYNTVMDAVNGNYFDLVLPLFCFMLSLVMLFRLFTDKEYKIYAQYIIIYSLMFLNPFAISMYLEIGIEPVTSRIIAFSLISYLIILVAFKTLHTSMPKILLFIWAGISLSVVTSGVESGIKTKESQFTTINQSLSGIASYDFKENSFVVFDNLNASKGSEVYYTGINKMVILNPSLSWDPKITDCDQLEDSNLPTYDHCYTIYEKAKAEDVEYAFETTNYLVYENF